MWGEGAHSTVCRKPRGGARSGGENRERFAGVAFTAWRREAQGPTGVWLVDSRSTQHITAERSQFASYEKLARVEKIEGLGGKALTAVGIGKVILECETPNGPSMVTLNEVWHVPGARANLFAMRRATDAGAKISFGKGKAQFEMGVVVKMEAVQRGGLWEIATVKKARALLAVKTGPVQAGRRAKGAAAKKPQVTVVEKQMEVKPVRLIEVEINSDDEGETETEKHAAAEDVGAAAADVGTTAAEDVGAIAVEGVGVDSDGKRYPERARVTPGKFWESGMGWVTPKAKKRMNKSG